MSFERKLLLGYAAVALFIVALGALGTFQLRRTIFEKDRVIFDDAGDVIAADRLRLALAEKGRKTRSYLLTGSEAALAAAQTARADESFRVETLEGHLLDDESRRLLQRAEELDKQYDEGLERLVALRRTGPPLDQLSSEYEKLLPILEELDSVLDLLARREDAELRAGMRNSVRDARSAGLVVAISSIVALLFASGLGLLLLRSTRSAEANRRLAAQRLDQLTRSNADLDAFAARVSHDVRSVLAPLPLVVAQLKRLRADPPEASARLGEKIEAVARRASSMMDALLAFSRGGRGIEGVAPRAAADAVLGQVLDDLRSRADDLEVTLEAQLQPAWMRCPPELLYVVALNLINNAIKFVSASPTRVVRVVSGVENGKPFFVVEDTGPGIPRDAREHLFEPFYRVPGTRAPGTGIGLATVARIVSAHDGRVEVHSEVGRGTAMRVTLPMAESGEDWVEPPPPRVH